ncbi:MAG: hypothetical protein SFV53_01590 [Rickettsiales bacterium]|nr:hypothetical protein [Rickettsiales bacterium]
MKKFMILLSLISALITLVACTSQLQREAEKTAKQNSASGRINSTNSNSDNLFNEMDK